MDVYVVVKRSAYHSAGDELSCLGVFQKIEDARKRMKEDFLYEDYDSEDCEEYSVEEDCIYVIGNRGFSNDHYWAEIQKMEVE